MKKQLLVLATTLISMSTLCAQYLPVAKQGRLWYSMAGDLSSSHFTVVLGVEGDTSINGTNYPLLVLKDSLAQTVDTLGYMDEDTVQGSLRIEFFGNKPTQYYDFSLQKGDTVYHTAYFNHIADSTIVDSVYTITDFSNVSRKVIHFRSADNWSNNCDFFRQPWIEGLGGGILIDPLISCRSSGYPFFRLRCVFDGPTKIYGDTVQLCYSENGIGLKEVEVQQLKVFPNPASSTLSVDTDARVESMRVRSLSGASLIFKQSSTNTLDVSHLPKGMYVLELTSVDGGRAVSKFIKD